jgi:hypothetical protein
MAYPIARSAIITALQQVLEPLDDAFAFWEAGSAAFDRVDEYSDLDLQVVVSDEQVERTVVLVEQTLRSLSPIAARFEVPQPTWHGHWQALYQLRDASPYHLIDFCIMKESSAEKFIQPEIHGLTRVLFDKKNIIKTSPLDPAAFAANLQHRLDSLQTGFFMSKTFVEKELLRSHNLDAFGYYISLTLRPLVEALRLRHKPSHYNFGARYLYLELPPDVVAQLEPLFFVASAADLRNKREQAERMFYETVADLDLSASIAADPAFAKPE